ncbi:Spy/CpxP family protein refolding chaperone [Desulfonatronum thioautotrophicum]|uniref:Spy/CpxP family protein refolding chaperone n=1 Tax=Desulfonatronum thioautotrophicum TaxID=617001 RepID=UPI0005EB0D96|nr:periplasmic heavy metal sensor [Desulfonatronum thioautotrophicum]
MRHFVSISAIFLALTLFAIPVLAQQHQHGADQPGKPRAQAKQHQGDFDHPVLGNLSPEQQEAMTELFEEHRKSLMQLNLQLRAKQAELDVLLAAAELDQAQVYAVSTEIITLQGEAMQLNNQLRRTVFEETGHLMSSKGAGRYSGMAGHGKKARMGRGGCPMMFGHGAH